MDKAVNPLHQAIGFRSVRTCCLVPDAIAGAQQLERSFPACRVLIPCVGFERVLSSVVGKDRMQDKGKVAAAVLQEVAGRLRGAAIVDTKKDQTCGAIDGHKAMLA